ncbi:MAG TPA: hypothetical protein VHS28_03390 [Chloroflexota bacterium]|nr:hypothetical protein [Chloroflexota bacterium]
MRQAGPYFIDQMVTTLSELREWLPGLSPVLSLEAQVAVGERLQRLSDMLVPIRKKLFVKTQGGSEMARQCAEKVAQLRSLVLDLEGIGGDMVPDRLEAALGAAEAGIEPFVDKTQNLVIRMT